MIWAHIYLYQQFKIVFEYSVQKMNTIQWKAGKGWKGVFKMVDTAVALVLNMKEGLEL